MPYLDLPDGARMFYAEAGSGPLLVLVHGGTGTGAYDWELVGPALAREHRVVTIDMRGHGRSSDPHWRLGLEQVGDDVLALIARLGEQPAAIVAFSVGGTAMLHLMCRAPATASAFVVIGCSPHGHPERIGEVTSGPWPRDLVELRHEHGEGPDHWQRLRECLGRTWAQGVTREQLLRVDVPTLVACGDRDAIEPVETALELARTLPRGELLVVPAAGHFVARQRPGELLAAVEPFLARHRDGA